MTAEQIIHKAWESDGRGPEHGCHRPETERCDHCGWQRSLAVADSLAAGWRSRWPIDTTDPAAFESPTVEQLAEHYGVPIEVIAGALI